MRDFDVFNGDADGICALHQLRLAEPRDAELVTGLKHEIVLLDRVDAGPGDRVTVLDLSMERNHAALLALLARGASVTWFDHHYSGPVPDHPALHAVLDPTGRACTSVLVDRQLGGRFRAWAVVGAFGDNFPEAAAQLARGLGLDAEDLARLRELGEALNYNAYGADERDVLLGPLETYRMVSRHAEPFGLFEGEPAIARLAGERRADLERAGAVPALHETRACEVHVLPDASWSRRVTGCFANRLALDRPHRAHAVLAPLPGGGYSVSVRSPAVNAIPAVEFCRRYPGGGGRARAAGIERLAATGLDEFVAAFAAAYAPGPRG